MRYASLQNPSRGFAPSSGIENESRLWDLLWDLPGTVLGPVLDALARGSEGTAVRIAKTFGFRDEDRLTSLVFFARHPERDGRKLKKGEPRFTNLRREWLDIRQDLVRPILRGGSPLAAATACHRKSPAERARIRSLAGEIERAGILPGFATFAEAAAATESDWRHRAANCNPGERKAARSLFRKYRAQGFYGHNPFPEDRWSFGSGGWFGLLPAAGLAAGGKEGPFAREDPFLVFDRVASVVMLADFVRRVVAGQGARDWLAVRRGMAAPGLVKDETAPRSLGVRDRFEKALRRIGKDPGFMRRRVVLRGYPGAAALLKRLRESGA